MITTDFVPGSPCWLDLGAPDVAAAARFYGAVFGWEHESHGPPGEQAYGLFRLDGRVVGAVGPLTEAGARSAWTVYFSTPDADAAARDAEQAGGSVRVAPVDADDEGRLAQLSDPQGAQFAVWQPGAEPGLQAVDQPGTLGWIELMTTDSAAAQQFYGALFGWRFEDIPLPGGGGTYTLLCPSGLGQERMHGGMMQLPADAFAGAGDRPYWHPVFGSTDTDATLAKITSAGGSVRMGPEDAEGVGRLAVCVDQAGAEFVVLTPAPE